MDARRSRDRLVRYVGGVLLEGREILLTDWLIRQAVDYVRRRDGRLPGGAQELAAGLSAFAGRETVAVVASGPRESGKPAAAVIVQDSRPAEMTASDVAALLGITRQAVCGACRSGKLLASKTPAGQWRVDAASAAAAAARRKGPRDGAAVL